jgi:hypothetical protein
MMDDFMRILIQLGADLWKEFVYILPYLAVGVLIEAIIRTFKWHVKIRKVLVRLGPWAIPAAALLGVVSPLCACATLPLVISLLLAGVPLAPAVALLVTSPIMSPSSYSMISGMLGIEWATLILVSAIFLGLFAGYLTLFLRPYGFSEEIIFKEKLPAGDFHDPDYPVESLRCECGQQLSHRVDRCTHNKFLVFAARFWEGSLKIGKFALIGLVVEVVALSFISVDWMTSLLSHGGILQTLLIMAATIPMHLPQVTAASMLYGFYLPDPGQTIALAKGPGIALLIGGPVTALPVMAVLYSMFHKRVLALYLALCVTGTMLLAIFWQTFSA